MRKIISLLIVLVFCISTLPVSAAPDPYWALQAAYNEAVKTETTADDVPACEGIISHYEKLDSVTACLRIVSPLLRVVKIYESTGQFDKALRCYKLYKATYEYLDKHTEDDCSEALKYADSFIRQYSFVTPTVYTSAYSPADVKYYGAKNEHKVGTYTGMCGYYNSDVTNGKIVYVEFGNENIYSFGYKLPETNDNYMLELAWNVSDHSIENFRNIADGNHDSYIIENLKFLGSLTNCKVMLRFAAEVNEWEVNTTYSKNGKINDFKKAYIDAFRHVSDLAETHCPAVAMVYSPNDISNMHVSATDFYPGDDYVDWIGMSSYMNKSSTATNEWSSMTDAYYNRGVYANQLMKIKDIVDAFGDKKPIMISESGWCYSSTNSAQTTEHAKEKMEFFMSYVNMVFPQVKALFYFNTNMHGNSYQLFDEDGSSVHSLSQTYLNCINSNIPVRSMHENKPQGYTKLTTINEVRDNLYLAVFASYPGNPGLNVSYAWDGSEVAKTNVVPYSTEIKSDKLTQGEHELKVTTNCLNTTYEQYFTVKVDNGKITATEKIIEKPVEEPKPEPPVEEPKPEAPVEQPVEEPKLETPVEQPVEEPKPEAPAEDPIPEAPTEETPVENPTDEPDAEVPTETPEEETSPDSPISSDTPNDIVTEPNDEAEENAKIDISDSEEQLDTDTVPPADKSNNDLNVSATEAKSTPIALLIIGSLLLVILILVIVLIKKSKK